MVLFSSDGILEVIYQHIYKVYIKTIEKFYDLRIIEYNIFFWFKAKKIQKYWFRWDSNPRLRRDSNLSRAP